MNQNEIFINKAEQIHKNKYDYSLVDYKNSKEKVIIICPIHAEFKITPSGHLTGRGCQKCSLKNKIKKLQDTKEDFINKIKTIYNDRYDLSDINYVNSNTNIILYDKTNNSYINTKPKYLLNPKKKPNNQTNHNIQKSTKDFINDAKEIHGDKYDYSLVDYKNNKAKVIVICPIHGEFKTNRKLHINKKCECRKCAIIKKGKLRRVNKTDLIEKFNYIHDNKYEYILPNDLSYDSVLKINCPVHGWFNQHIKNHNNGKGCLKCGGGYSSSHEYIKKILIKNDINFKENNRDIIKPYELDFYLPDHKLAIEVNGIYWHSELKGKDKNYHLNKTNLCKEKGIKLIHINENEFINSKQIIKSKLNSILNINKKPIYGRKCIVKEIDSKTKSKFLSKYHLQGNDKALIKLGLFYNNKLISVMTFCKRRVCMGKKSSLENEYELSRFCNSFNFYVIGGASKLLKYFERNYKPSKIVTYTDKRWSTGDLYFKLDFKHTHDSKPNYWYFYKKTYQLYHRFNFRKSELPKKLKYFDINLTEWENMKSNGWNRIWDCGNMVFEKSYLTE